MMKYVKRTEVIVEITEDMIKELNRDIGSYAGIDFHDKKELGDAFFDWIEVQPWEIYEELPDYILDHTTVNSEEGIVDETK